MNALEIRMILAESRGRRVVGAKLHKKHCDFIQNKFEQGVHNTVTKLKQSNPFLEY